MTGSTLLRACAGDVASLAQARSLAGEIEDSVPRPGVRVNNAGIGGRAHSRGKLAARCVPVV